MTGLLHDYEFFSKHNTQDHAEFAGRLSLVRTLENMERCPLRPASDDELLTVHTKSHLKQIQDKCAQGGGMLDPDTYCVPESEAVARAAVGGLIDLSLNVLAGNFSNGLALIRPPGHHATADKPMGFCLYNNVAVAAAALRANGAAKVAIIDFDVHHGNGTQDIFYADNTVLYASSHQYPHYPGSGAAEETGSGIGVGYTLNHPLKKGTGDKEFLDAYRRTILPAVLEFDPDFILVSAGFDAHVADPLAELNVSTAGFASLVELLVKMASEVCGGRIVFALEGGYNPNALAQCISCASEIVSTYHECR